MTTCLIAFALERRGDKKKMGIATWEFLRDKPKIEAAHKTKRESVN
jgi:hypothetical protein